MFKFSHLMFQAVVHPSARQMSETEKQEFSLQQLSITMQELLSLKDNERQELYHNLQRHAGEESTFTHKEELLYALMRISNQMHHERHSSKKLALASGLICEIHLCTNGFYNRVMAIYTQ